MAKVSIIIATHSRPHLLPRAVNSAFAAGTDVEVVVVDDASTDETADVCKTLEGIKYIRVDRNQRTAGARNLGILASTAPYIGFLDDDDWRLPGSLDRQTALLEKNPECGLVYGQYLQADNTGEITDDPPQPAVCEQGDLFWKLMESNRFGCLTAVFRRECLYRVGMLDPNYSGSDDWDLWVRIAELYEIAALEEPVAVWRTALPGTGQGSSNETLIYSQVVRLYKEKLFGLPRVVNELGDGVEKKKKEFIRLASERIVHDMVYKTTGKGHQFSKLVEAVRISPERLFELGFYKMVVKNMFSRGAS